MAFGQDFLKGFFGSDFLKDYEHAHKTFTSAGMSLAPKQKFLFHVHFNLNVTQLPFLNRSFASSDSGKVSVLVKNIQLPQYTFDTDTYNQYNRKKIVQSKVNYSPVSVEFHDDHSNTIRDLWFNYFSYYYKDPSQKYGGSQSNNLFTEAQNSFIGSAGANNGDLNRRDIYEPTPVGSDWGYMGEAEGGRTDKPPFFRDITIFGLSQHNFSSYTLINPVLNAMNHDTYDYSAGAEVMNHTWTIEYETVKYGSGSINENGEPIPGFARPEHYDHVHSSLDRPGSAQNVFGRAGLVDAGFGFAEDLASGNILGAIQTAGRTFQNFKDVNLGDLVRDEATQGLVNALRTGSPLQAANDFLFATPPTNRTKRNVLSKKVDSSDPANKRAISVSSNGTILTSNR
jgi:hypothetical protein